MKKIVDISGKKGVVEVVLDREGMEVEVVGVFRTKGRERHELSIRIIHKAKRTSAKTVLRGVVEDQSFLKLVGTIVIEKDAQQTNSFLKENVLLLSPDAKAETVPNLEILANDVKCSHAATISQIPEEHLFYLMSRGLTKKQAEQMIVDGFLTIPGLQEA
ncbi:MAG TPA: SufD family Fe-S cluster assembly protein [Patescibacteria group bacterium]|nr:SufD family Fe-S cluster assembly protein [Patescibacteria group bacterium]